MGSSRRDIGLSPPAQPDSGWDAVIVLGYPSTGAGRLHPLQRWRTQIAVRSMDPRRDTRLIFTGAARNGEPSEAAMMSQYAHEVLGVPAASIILETKAKTTGHNIEFSLPLIDAANTIRIASDPLHAARGRRYLHELRPDLFARVARADDYRFMDHWWLKLPTAVYECCLAARQTLLPK